MPERLWPSAQRRNSPIDKEDFEQSLRPAIRKWRAFLLSGGDANLRGFLLLNLIM